MKKGIVIITALFAIIGSGIVPTIHADGGVNPATITPFHGVDH